MCPVIEGSIRRTSDGRSFEDIVNRALSSVLSSDIQSYDDFVSRFLHLRSSLFNELNEQQNSRNALEEVFERNPHRVSNETDEDSEEDIRDSGLDMISPYPFRRARLFDPNHA